MKRPRIRLWMMMVAVAIVGAVLFAWRQYAVIIGLEYDYRGKAMTHTTAMKVNSGYQVPLGQWVPPNPRRIDYHAAMKAKYEHAARYPWLPVAPDPPEPE